MNSLNATKPRLLMLTHRVPFPPDRGDRIRSYHILKHLAPHYDISLACLSDEPVSDNQRKTLTSLTSRLAIQPINPFRSKLQAACALVTGKPITPACFYHQTLASTINQWHTEKPFSAIFTYCSAMLPYARQITDHNPDIRHVVDLIDVDSHKWHQYAQQTISPKRYIYATEANRLRKLEQGRCDRIDAMTLVSPAEATIYRRHVTAHPPFPVTAMPNGVDLDYFAALPDPDNHNILFTGVLNYKPNVDALLFFAHEVLPYLAQYLENTTLTIVGRHVSKPIQSLASHPNINLVGPVRDVRPYLLDATAVVAPMLIARGLQNKVLEAMASQRVAICSPAAAEGINAQHDKHLLIADHPNQWVDQLVRVLTFPAWRKSLAQNARQQIETHYTWSCALKPLLGLIEPELKTTKQIHSLAA